ncbi:MAG: hypothetical protein HYY93_01160 [Planctomycetes bacterium]|nr:hypothetical protein [Planctomycetota bacterium]
MNGSIYFVTFRSRQGELAPSERDVVLSAFKFWHLKRYWLTVIVVMLDHGHAVLKPLRMAAGGDFPFAKIMQGLKGFTSRQINERRGRRGQFWQAESYDRIVRDEAEFIEKWNYVRVNPVRSWKACATHCER